jgi:1,2-diacylglycerol 3-beta-galactosyltransferase
MVWPYVRRGLHRLVKDHRCDLIVSLHQLSNAPVLRAMRKEHIPFVTVVLDMVSTHAFWYDNRADQVVVPTEAARQVGLKCGVDGQKMTVIGLPVAERFCQPRGDRATLRESLGWPQDRPIVLMVGGGDGMGPLEQTAVAIDNLKLDAALMVVCGRNQKLKETLEERTWNTPTKVFGFVRDMPTFMRASDILVTKAGPGTISEAFIAELPMVLYSRLPGQEDGNVGYVEDQGAGVWAPEPELAANAVRRWLLSPHEYQQAVAACKRLARPNASRDIARLLAARVGVTHPAASLTPPNKQ